MILTVKAWKEMWQAHECDDEQGNIHLVDLLVDATGAPAGDPRIPCTTPPEELVGCTVEVEDLEPFIEIAVGARVIEEAPDGNDAE